MLKRSLSLSYPIYHWISKNKSEEDPERFSMIWKTWFNSSKYARHLSHWERCFWRVTAFFLPNSWWDKRITDSSYLRQGFIFSPSIWAYQNERPRRIPLVLVQLARGHFRRMDRRTFFPLLKRWTPLCEKGNLKSGIQRQTWPPASGRERKERPSARNGNVPSL